VLEASGFHPGRSARNHLRVVATAAGLPPARADQVLEQVGLSQAANGLDPEGIHWLRGLLRQLADQGRTVLVSSHVLAEVARPSTRW
jgi:ABC-2 type transport system ATP-binding protein